MANTKEIQDRIKSINDTLKITNAMYMISSSKLKKAKKMLKAKTPDDFEHTDSDAWFYDEATATLHISATMQSEETKIVIE